MTLALGPSTQPLAQLTSLLADKTPTGRLSTKQRDRRTELARAGGVYLCVKSVKSAVMQLVKVREVLAAGQTMQEAVLAVEGLGW